MVSGVFDELASRERPRNHFTVGIVDDVTHTSLGFDPELDIDDDERVISGSIFGDDIVLEDATTAGTGQMKVTFQGLSFTSDGLWVQGAATSSADPTARLSRWRSVLQRMRSEGLELRLPARERRRHTAAGSRIQS